MSSQFEILRAKFDKLPTLADKKTFITNFDAQIKKFKINDPEHKNFLSDCIRKYNAEFSEQSTPAAGAGSAVINTESCPFSNKITGVHSENTAKCPLGHIPHPDFVPPGEDAAKLGYLYRSEYCRGKASPQKLNEELDLLNIVAPNITAKLPPTKRMWHYCPYIREELSENRMRIHR